MAEVNTELLTIKLVIYYTLLLSHTILYQYRMRTTLIQARERSSQQHGNGNFTSIIKGNKVSLVEGDSVVLDSAFLDTRTKTADRINLEEDLTLKFNVVQYTMNSNWRFKSYFGLNNATSGLSTNGASILNTMKPAYLGKWVNAETWNTDALGTGKTLFTLPKIVRSLTFTPTGETGEAFNLQLRYPGLNGENQYTTIPIQRTTGAKPFTYTFPSITDQRETAQIPLGVAPDKIKEQVLLTRSSFEVVEPTRMNDKGWSLQIQPEWEDYDFVSRQEYGWSPTNAGFFALEPAHINTQIVIPAGTYDPSFLAEYITTQMNRRYNANFSEPVIVGQEAINGFNPVITYDGTGGQAGASALQSIGTRANTFDEIAPPNITGYTFNTDPGVFGKQIYSYQTPQGELVRYDCSGYVGNPFCCSENGLNQEKQPAKDIGRVIFTENSQVAVGRGTPLEPYYFQSNSFALSAWTDTAYIIKPDNDTDTKRSAGRTDSTYGQPIEAYPIPSPGGGGITSTISGYIPGNQGQGKNVFAFKCMDEYTPILVEGNLQGTDHTEPFAYKYTGLMEWGDDSAKQPGVSTAQICGASQTSLEYEDGFKWTYLHTPLYGGATGSDIVASSIPSCYLDGQGQAFPQALNNTTNQLTGEENFHASNGGVFFSCLEPASFWEDTLGFDLSDLNVSMTYADPTKYGFRKCEGQTTASTRSTTAAGGTGLGHITQGGKIGSLQYVPGDYSSSRSNACFHQHALAGSTAMGGAINISVIAPDITMKRCSVGKKWTRGIIETATNTIDIGVATSISIKALTGTTRLGGTLNGAKIIPYPNTQLSALNQSFTSIIIQSSTEEIVAGNSQLNANNEGYFLIEVNAKMNNSFTGSSFNSNLIMGIVDRYYTTGNYTSATGGNIEYTHYGEPVYLSEVGVRILNPDGTLGNVGSDNSIFLKVNKQIIMPQKQTTKKS